MARNYQHTKNNPHWLPHNVYMRVIYIVRDYDRMKQEQSALIHSTPAQQGGSRSGLGNPTENKAIILAQMSRETDAVDRALAEIPEEYRRGVFRSAAYRDPYPITANESTWRRWKYRFTYAIAQNLRLIEP